MKNFTPNPLLQNKLFSLLFYQDRRTKSSFIGLFILFLLGTVQSYSQTTYYLTLTGAIAPQNPVSWVSGGGAIAQDFNGTTDIFVVPSNITASYPAGATVTILGTLQVDGSIIIGTNIASTTTLTVNGTILLNSTGNQITFGSGGTGTNKFVLGANATLKTQNTKGIVGAGCSILLNGAKTSATLPTTANYEFNGTVDQATLGLPSTVGSLTINNPGHTVTLNTNTGKTISNAFTVSAGTVNTNAQSITCGSLNGSGIVNNGNGTATYTLTVGNTNNLSSTFSGAISNTNGIVALKKSGTGTLILDGTNLYTGTTTVSAGILKLGSAAALGATPSATVSSGGTLDLNGFTVAVPLTISGTGAALSGALTNTGTDALYSGDITLAATSTITSAGSGTLTCSGNIGGAALTLNGAGNGVISGVISTASLTKSGAGIWTLSGANTYTGTTTVSAGTLKAGSNAAFGNSSAVSMTNALGATLDLNNYNNTIGSITAGGATGGNITLGTATLTIGSNSASTAYAGAISGDGGIIKTGAGTLTLSGINTYKGATNINSGTLKLGSTSALGTSSNTTVAPGAVLDLSGKTLSTALPLTLNGKGITGSGALTNTSVAASYKGDILLGSDTTIMATSSGTLTCSGAVTGTSASTLTLDGSGTGVMSGIISDPISITKNGTGTWTLSGLNNYTGATNITTGTLKLGSTSALGASPTTVTDGAVLNLNGSAVAHTSTLTLNGTGIATAGVLTNTGTAASYDGNIILGSATTITATNSGTLSCSGTVTGAFPLTLDGTGSGTMSAAIDNPASITKTGTGTWTLSGANTYSGDTNINTGTLKLGSATALGSSATTVNTGAVLNLNGSAVTHTSTLTLNGSGIAAAGALTNTGTAASYDGNIILGSATTITATSSGTLTCSGTVTGTSPLTLDGAGSGIMSVVISDPASLTKNGAGTWTLAGANTYTGATTINAGILKAGSATITDSGNITSGAFGISSVVTIANLATATLDITGYDNTVGLITGGGKLILAGATLTTGSANTGTNTYAGIISGTSGSITKIGTGTLILAGTNTYNGNTNITSGILKAGKTGALGSSSITVSDGAVLDMNGFAVARPLTLYGTGIAASGALTNTGVTAIYSGAITLGSPSTITATSSGTLSCSSTVTGPFGLTLDGDGTGIISGVISTPTSINKSGTGTWTLSGTNTYGGTTNINKGTLKAGKAGALGNSSVIVSSGALLDMNGFAIARPLTLNGSGLTNTGIAAATYSGPITLGSDSTITTTATGAITCTAGVTGAFGLTLDGTGTGTVSTISSPTSITKIGAGKWTLSGVNTYIGATTVNEGTLKLGSTTALGAATNDFIISNGAMADVAFNVTVKTLTLGNLGTISGTWGSTASPAVHKDATYFVTPSAGIITVTTSDTRTTPTVDIPIGTYKYTALPQGPDSATNSGTGTTYTYSYTGVNGTSYGPSSTQPTNAGSYTVNVTVDPSADGLYKSASSGAKSFSIDQIPLTITAKDASKCYGTTYNFGTPAYTSNGLIGGETIENVTLTSAGTDLAAAIGSYSIVPSAPTGITFITSNYAITYINGALTVETPPTTPIVDSITQPSCTVNTGSVVFSGLPVGSWTMSSMDNVIVTAGTGTSYTAPALASGTYNFRITIPAGCSSPETSSIVINTAPVTPAIPTIGTIVKPTASAPNGSFTIANYNSAYTYTVTPSTGVNVSGNPITAPEGTYTVTATLGDCTSAASGNVSLINTTMTWVETGNSNWFNPDNWNPNGIPTSSTDVIIPTGSMISISSPSEIAYANTVTVANGGKLEVAGTSTLTVTDKVIVNTDGTLNLLSGASLLQVSNNANIGIVNVYRASAKIILNDYTYWSSPTWGTQKLLDFSPNTTAKYFLAYSNGWTYLNASATTFTPGTGYSILAPNGTDSAAAASQTFQFIGTPNNGDVSVHVDKSATLSFSSKLVGNPYPSAIDADKFIDTNMYNAQTGTGTISGTLYFWTHNNAYANGTYTSNDYATYTKLGGTSSSPDNLGHANTLEPQKFIASCQGFVVQTVKTGNVIFTNAMRTTGTASAQEANTPPINGNFYKNANAVASNKDIEKNRIWINFTNNSGANFSQILLGYVETATNNYDPGFDGTYNSSSKTGMYSLIGNSKYAIQAKASPFLTTDTVPLGYTTDIKGNATISIDSVDGLFTNGQEIFVEDKLLNVVHKLNGSPYTFSSEAGTFNSRFVLRYTDANTAKSLGLNGLEEVSNNVVISSQNQTIKIKSETESINKVFVYDVLGREIYQNIKIDSNETSISDLKDQQILIVKVVLANGKSVSRKVAY